MKKGLIILSVIVVCAGVGVILYFNSCAYLNKKADKLFLQDEFEQAASLYQKSVDKGDGYACYKLGELYRRGVGVDSVDKEKAFNLFETGSERGCIEAQARVALCYLYGTGIEEDKDKGAEILNNLFETTDNAFVKSWMGIFYITGEFEFWPKDVKKAISLFQECAEHNDVAARSLGTIYFFGEYETVDYNKALYYYKLADSLGSSSVQRNLGSIYLHGEGNVSQDKKKAIYYYEKGVKRGNTDCLLCLYSFYTFDDEYKDERRALSYLNKAIDWKSGKACFFMGNNYMDGSYGLPKDDEKAFEFFKKSAQYGNPEGMYNLGTRYFHGIGTERNLTLAEKYYKEAANKGNSYAAWNLYYNITTGIFNGTEADAKKYFKMALDKNNVGALKMWARQYITGRPIFQDDVIYVQPQQAFSYMKAAADQGDAEACATIAEWYERGYGCNMNKAEAERYRNMVGVEKKPW